MTDKKDFNAEVYKNNVKNIKLSEKQKAELIKVMRDTEKQYKQNNVSHKVLNRIQSEFPQIKIFLQ